MDIHNIDDYLDLQDQTATNLLSSEQISQSQHDTEEWHTATPLSHSLLATNENALYRENATEWGLLQNGFDLQGINLTQTIAKGDIVVNTNDHHAFVAPDTLMKQPTVDEPVSEKEEKRVTRSRTAAVPKPAADTPPLSPKKKKTRAKKLYCICQQPYDGKPMVQCDKCEQWFHCTCVSFDPDAEEDIDWSCQNCIEAGSDTQNQELETSIADSSKTNGRQTRRKTQSKCLYSGCNNRTRADSFCSDVCARKHNESTTVAEEADKQEKPRVSRRASMRTAAMSVSSKKLSPPSQRRTGVNRRNFEADEELDKEEEQQDEKHEDSDKEKSAESDKEEHDEYIDEESKVDDKEEAEAEVEPGQEEEEEEEQEDKADSKSPEPFADPSQMTEQENPVRRNVIKNLTTILKTIIESALVDNPDMYDNEKEKLSPEERANSLAKSIENTMLQELGDMAKGQRHRTCGERYKSKFRSLLHNLKDKANKVFQLRVITGDLEPSELVKMSSEDMANPELKSMSELLREKGLKNSVMKLENVPIIKKTHKGDIIMVPNEPSEERSMYSEQVQRELDKIDTKSQSPVTEERKVINSFSPTTSTNNGKMDPLDDILARIGIPNNEETNGKRSSIASAETTDQEAKKRKIALDVEQLLGEEEDTPFEVDEVDINELAEQDEDKQEEDPKTEAMEVDGQRQELPTIWNGRVNMPQVAEFEASARQIGGRQLADEEWSEVLSPTMWIEGRIPTDRVTNYITQTQYSTSREIILIEIQAQGADTNQQSQTLLQYLDSRQRYAVVGHNKTKIKDFYLIPLYKTKQIPDCLYVVRLEERKRDCDLFLGVLVLSKQHSTPTITTSLPQQKTSNSLPSESSSGPITIPPSLSSISIPPQLQYAISQISALQQQQPPSLTVQLPQQQQQQQQQQNPYNYPQPAQVHHTHTHNVHSHNISSQSHHQQQHHRQNHHYQRHPYRQDDHHRNRYQNDHRPSY